MSQNMMPKYNAQQNLIKLECQACGANLEILDDTHAYCKYCDKKYIINVLNKQPAVKPPAVKNSSAQNTYIAIGISCLVVFVLVVMSVIFSAGKEVKQTARPGALVSIGNTSPSEEFEEWDGFRTQTMQRVVYEIFGKPADEVTEKELATIRYFKFDSSWINESCTVSYSTEDYREYPQTYDQKMPEYSDEVPFGYNEAFEESIHTISLPYLQEDYEYICGDIRNFKNLTAISLESYDEMDFSQMSDLTMVDCGYDDFDTLLNSNLPKEQIEVLKVDDCDLTGLNQFTSLKHLFLLGVDAEYMEQIAYCSTLETLFCVSCFDSASYAPLKQLIGLKSLYIRGSSDGVKDLSMISAFTELENLSITNTDILSIGFVKDLPKLKTLRLSENGELEDFSGLGDLQNLEFLELNLNDLNGNQPEYAEIGKLKNLKKLALHTVYNLDFLHELDQLEELEVCLTFYNDLLAPVSKMKNLRELTIAQGHTNNLNEFACLKDLAMLQKLTIHSMEFDESVDGLFALDTLDELHLTNCQFEVPPRQITVTDKLKVLNLSGSEFDTPYNFEGSYVGEAESSVQQGVLNRYGAATALEELYLDYYEINDLSVLGKLENLKVLSLYRTEITGIAETDLQGCSLLEELTISQNQIADISFAKHLPNLSTLRMEDCYVTDLSPLLNCPKLRYVNAKENPIAENPLENVIVITE